MPRSIAHPPDQGASRLLADSPHEMDLELHPVKIPPVWMDLVEMIKHDLAKIVLESKVMKEI